MTLEPHQIRAAKEIRSRLYAYRLALLVGQPRSGKTLSFLDVCKDYKNPLVLTTKAAVPDIIRQAEGIRVPVTVTNHHQLPKLESRAYDLVVIDECHRNFSSYPKPSGLWKEARRVIGNADLILSSGTPTAEGYPKLFHPIQLSAYSPWRMYRSFYAWHKDYGRPYTIKINGLPIKQYDKINTEYFWGDVARYVVTITREEAGHRFDAHDILINIKMSKKQEKFYKKLDRDQVIGKYDIVADTPTKLITKLHQIAGGFILDDWGEVSYAFDPNPKIEWLKKNIDPDNTIILANYKAEQDALSRLFPNVGSVTRNAEGVDYSHFDKMVIYSMNFSAAGYEQVRARQLNIKRSKPVEIVFLLSGIDNYVYKAVSAKQNFTSKWYERIKDA